MPDGTGHFGQSHTLDKHNARARDRALRKLNAIRAERGLAPAVPVNDVAKNGRRSTEAPVPTGQFKKLASPDLHGTMSKNMVRAVDDGPVLKRGGMSVKLGDQVLVGRLSGAAIYALTLEERATCPRSCALYRACYGNNMQYAHRVEHGRRLEEKLCGEVADLCAQHEQVLIRLHILGDFYSSEYVAVWAGLLALHPGLTIFGFTAWTPKTQIGRSVATVRAMYPQRFMIRESGRDGTWGSFTIDDPFPPKTVGESIVCPEQRDANTKRRGVHCGNCGLCWATDRAISFIRH